MSPQGLNRGDGEMTLVERLRATETRHVITMLGHTYPDVPINPDGPEAADTLEALVEAGNALSLAAQTTGGIAGRDDALVEAINKWASALSLVRTGK